VYTDCGVQPYIVTGYPLVSCTPKVSFYTFARPEIRCCQLLLNYIALLPFLVAVDVNTV
jgi:hypothetical protein